jgi:predicted nucleic acid-binding protein
MSEIVLDPSVALKWATLPEPLQAEALKLRDDFRANIHSLIAPDIFTFEIGHVLSKLHRTHKLTAKEAEDALVEILTTCPELRDSLPLFPRAFELSLQTRASLWDCTYLALSEQTGAPLVTADERLIKNLGAPSNVIHLSKVG